VKIIIFKDKFILFPNRKSMNVVDATDDALLWGQFQQGDPIALGKLMTKNYTALIQYGTKFNREKDDLRDCIQDIFVDLWNCRTTLSRLTTSQVLPYLMAMLRRLLHKKHLLRQRVSLIPIDDEYEDTRFNISFSPEDQLIEAEKAQANTQHIQQLINQLPTRAKEAIYLRFYHNIDRPSIAQIMGISEQSVSNLFQTTFRQLRHKVSAEIFWLLLLLPLTC
jgi:RNA polymerase sigma factor (sigma-70 family)